MGQRLLRISNSLFVELFTAGKHDAWEVVDGAIPKDARIVNARMEFSERLDGGDVHLLLESSEWSPVGDEMLFPEITPVMKRLYLID